MMTYSLQGSWGFCVVLADIPKPSDVQIRHALETVYARPEFSQDGGPSLLQLMGRMLGQFFLWLGELSSKNPLVYWILLCSCLVLLVLLLVHIVWTVRRVFFHNPALAQGNSASAERAWQSAHYWNEALRKAEANELTEAIRCLFLSLIYRFDESGKVNFLQAYTNREYLSLFLDQPKAHTALQFFVDTLDDCWYGERPADRGRYQQCLTHYEMLR